LIVKLIWFQMESGFPVPSSEETVSVYAIVVCEVELPDVFWSQPVVVISVWIPVLPFCVAVGTNVRVTELRVALATSNWGEDQ
jgi:hypothetical protein